MKFLHRSFCILFFIFPCLGIRGFASRKLHTMDAIDELRDDHDDDPRNSDFCVKSSLPPTNLWGLYVAPSRFFSERNLDYSPYYLLAAWVVGSARTIDRIDKNLMKSDFGVPDRSLELFTLSWTSFWVIVLGVGLLGAFFLWLIGGWWYRVRLNWAGAANADKREARLVYIFSSLVPAIPNFIAVAIATLFYQSYPAYWASEESWSLLLMVFPFWGVIVSYRGAVTRFEVRKSLAQLWFLWLPIGVYLLAFGSIVFAYSRL